ncbi:MAG: fasciclin domain-containing protein [Flammeovirgaceae bacterium]|nr:fasciclin domain-containing protein [Flammeovirgaceae bacterium]
MKNYLIVFVFGVLAFSCGQQSASSENAASSVAAPAEGGQSTVQDDTSNPDVVRIAVSSKDHTTLVAALKAAEYVDALSNAGPFTVFAPTDAAFAALPAGTVENLVKPENKETLRNILEYHVYVGVLNENMVRDGMKLNQVNLENVTLNVKDGKITVNGANVLGTARGSNGIVYIIDAVLLPPDNK